MKGLNQLRDEIHANAVAKGFYQVENETDQIGVDNRTAIKHAFFAQKIALIHSELSEALEADRNNKRADMEAYYENLKEMDGIKESEIPNYMIYLYKRFVKGSVDEEVADVIIRIFDMCGKQNIDIEKHVELKMEYNKQREYKHGKEY